MTKTLIDLCGWKKTLIDKKQENPEYEPESKTLRYCLYKCKGQTKSCGGYYEKTVYQEKTEVQQTSQ